MFPKEKTEKRKPCNQGGQVQKPKGNGISPEGWFWEERTKALCRSLLVGGAVGVRLIFVVLLFVF
ncbi:hypothetical protein [Elizabethkingia anophelis]|uniref:hypothetical protein n=1 Tax=Elizabethkingia anophelis TaxID=1117645 RepID=UPI0006675C4F|nr:hypothetical protein [Elizabethkingia anophelis]MCT3906782.1 hypothetical protein [Elizabethkingia anophelis]MCT4119408.1 hypothetical protein [Elizabethkingia anophelis]MCT4219216.1 hypothetical protein [Elizabethkingia anophelis]OCW74065.1 hypothetical protein A4G24_02810 [Elizabethkingia anophelis]